MRSKVVIVALAAISTACMTTYSAAPPLEFEDLPYESIDGRPWPLKEISLPGIAQKYSLPREPSLVYVELNPEGQNTLIFLHGLGSYLKFWRYQLDQFADDGFRVLAFDMLGYGKSDKPGTFPYTTEAMAEVVQEALFQLDIERPVIVGHSMGGQVAMSFAISHPDSLAALVLTAPAGFEHFSPKEVAWFDSVFSKSLIKGANEENIWASVRRNNFARWKKEDEWLIEERVRLAGGRDFDAYATANVKSVHGLARNSFVRENLAHIRVPTLIVYGTFDRLIPNPFLHGGDTAKLMKEGGSKIDGAELVELERCGHMVQMDCPNEYNRAVLTFLSDVSSGRAPVAKRTGKGSKR
jgi:pimeloyl-ACP methyl ester carboxylesterase